MAVHFLSEKFHLVLTSYWRIITYLFFSSHRHAHHMKSQILLILIDFLATFDLKLLFFKRL